MRPVLYLLFGLSGAAGLFYEMVWSRYLALLLGHSAYAQVVVISIFLGGMALGALWVGSRSERVRDPLVGYAVAELAVGAIGVFFHEMFLGITGFAHGALFPALAGHGVWLTLVKWALAALLILPQSMLLGATFPFMTAGILRRFEREPGRTLGLAYFANSFGAAIGVLVAGFYIVSLSGLPGTLLAAAMINLFAALVTISLARRYPIPAHARVGEAGEAGEAEEAPASGAAGAGASTLEGVAPVKAGRSAADAGRIRLLLAVSFGTAVASFAYEIGWLRMLALVLGSSTHSFELMLSAFILGLALGSFWVRRRADRWREPLRALGIVQGVMGLSALATLPLYAASFGWMADLLQVFGRTDAGYVGFTLARYALCLAIMLPASFCAGMTLPLITRALYVRAMGEGAIGKVYGVNTLGSIVGVALAGLVGLPWLGLKGLILAGAALDMALGAWILWWASVRGAFTRRWAYAAAGATALAVVVGAGSQSFDPQLLVSGIYRHGRLPGPDDPPLVFYADGRTATVAVQRRGDLVTITTNGKPDASLGPRWYEDCADSTTRTPIVGDESTQLLLSMITLAHAPHATAAAVIGQGSGMSSHFLLASPSVDQVVTVEIEPQMIRGSREFYPANRRVFDDPRSTIVIEDARTYFSSAARTYDVVVSEPSNPWVSGVASLFTVEFYAHVRRYLGDGGVFGQWMHLYEIDDGLVLSVLAAIHHSFGDYRLFLTASHDLLVVATTAPRLREPDWSVFRGEGITADLCRAFPLTPALLEATQLTDRRALAPLLDSWEQPNSDFYPVLDLLAERTRFLGTAADGFASLAIGAFNPAAPLSGRRLAPRLEGPPGVVEIRRVDAVARASALRRLSSAGSIDPRDLTEALRPVVYRWQQWQAMLSRDRPPADWGAWTRDFRELHALATAGTAGYAHDGFYAPIVPFLERHRAPQSVRDLVAFRGALDRWAFLEAASLADRLLGAGAHQDGLIAPEDLLDGAIVAKLAAGDTAGARRLYDTLVPLQRRHAGDLRSRLVKAYLEAATVPSATPLASIGGRGSR